MQDIGSIDRMKEMKIPFIEQVKHRPSDPLQLSAKKPKFSILSNDVPQLFQG